MGNDHVKNPQKASQEFQQIIPHKKFEKYKFVENNQIQITSQVNQHELYLWKNNLQKIKNLTDHEVLMLETSHKEDRNGLCTSNYKLDINFENYPYVFSDQIANRIQNKKYFEEPELWYLLFCLLIASKNFAALKSKIGDVRPYNIFINQQGQIKIANLFSWPYQKTNFQKTLYLNEATFLSPQQMAVLQKKAQNTTDRIKSQSFSIGLTMLNCLILYDATELYNSTFYSFDNKRLAQKLQQMKQFDWVDETNTKNTYSRLLKSIVYSLCNPNPQRRTSSLDLYNLLQPFQEQLMKLQSFDHNLIRFQYPPQFNRNQTVQAANISHQNAQFGYKFPPVRQSVQYPAQQHQHLHQQQQQPPQINFQNIPPVQQYQSIQQTSWNQPTQTQSQYRTSSNPPFQPVTSQIISQVYQGQKFPQALPPAQVKPVQITNYSHTIPQQYIPQFASRSSNKSLFSPQVSTSNWQRPLDSYIPNKMQTIMNKNFNNNYVQQSNRPQWNAIQVPKEFKSNAANNQFKNLNFTSFAASVDSSIKTSNANKIRTNQVTTNNSGFESDFLRKIDQQLQISRQKFP